MPFSSGSYTPPPTSYPPVSGAKILVSKFTSIIDDIATALSTCLLKDGTQTVTANIPLSNYKLTSLGNPTARTDAANLASIQDGTGVYVGTVGGTADAITLTPSPAITAYSAGQRFYFVASGANTGAVTVAISGLAAKSVTKNGTTALAAGDIPSGMMVSIIYDGTRFILGTTGMAFLPLAGGTLTGALTVNGQIAFPATANPSANANTLDDYEEGTWTPSVGGTATYTSQVGTYTKIGRLVHIYCNLAINAIGTGSQTAISGLPFSSAESSSFPVYFVTSATNIMNLIGTVSTSSIVLWSTTAAQASVGSNNIMGNGTILIFSGTYQT